MMDCCRCWLLPQLVLAMLPNQLCDGLEWIERTLVSLLLAPRTVVERVAGWLDVARAPLSGAASGVSSVVETVGRGESHFRARAWQHGENLRYFHRDAKLCWPLRSRGVALPSSPFRKPSHPATSSNPSRDDWGSLEGDPAADRRCWNRRSSCFPLFFSRSSPGGPLSLWVCAYHGVDKNEYMKFLPPL